MADLRERLEAALAFLQQEKIREENSDTPIKSLLELYDYHIATLREVLAHPEKLMGEPVAWQVRERSGRPLLVYEHPAEEDCAAYELACTPLYAPEVKP